MRAYFVGLLCLGLAIAHGIPAAAEPILQFDIQVDKSEYLLNETVQWMLLVATTTAADNEGIAGLSVDLEESQPESLFSAAIDPSFTSAGYGPNSGGTSIGSSLVGISVVNLFSRATAIGADGTWHTLATGSYTVDAPGLHTLATATPFPGDSNFYVANAGTAAFESIQNDQVQFQVVPEPSTFALAGTAFLAFLVVMRRRSLCVQQ